MALLLPDWLVRSWVAPGERHQRSGFPPACRTWAWRNNVSDQVLDAVARVLRLDDDERRHLFNLAQPARSARRRAPARPERVRPGARRLLEMADGMPGYVVGRRCDVLAWNRLACALFTDFDKLPVAERNWGRLIFLREDIQALFADWTIKARETVSYLRLRAGADPDDAELAALVGELSVKSEDFRRWWADHDVKEKTHGRKHLHHPLVGELTLDFETARLPDAPDQVLVFYTAEAGSPSENALRLLAQQAHTNPAHRQPPIPAGNHSPIA